MAFLYFYGMETALENLSKEDLLKMISARDQIISEHKKVIQDNEKVIQNHEKVIQDNEKVIQNHEKVMLNTETAILENHSTISALGEEVDYLKAQIAMYKRMQFGQKRERFEGDPNQVMLPFETPVQATLLQQEEVKQKIEYVRKRPNHHGRAKLPSHLPVEEIEIHPQGDLTGMVCIGKEITEELECEPARFFIKRYIRYKYAGKNGDVVSIAELPERVIDKGIPGAGLLASIVTDKYVDHLPLYRQKQRFARENIQIPSSTIEGWTKQALEKLEPLYHQLVFDIKAKGYLQVDETPIKVLEQ